MKKLSILAASIAFSMPSLSFENLIQDFDAGETYVSLSFSNIEGEVTLTDSSGPEKDTSTIESTEVTATHFLGLSDTNTLGFKLDAEQDSSEGENTQDFEAGMIFLTDSYGDTLGFGITYSELEDDQNELHLSIEKELSIASNDRLDGVIELDLGLNEKNDGLEGGHTLSIGGLIRATLTQNLQIQGALVLVNTQDYEFDSGTVYDTKPYLGAGINLSYAIIPNLFFDLAYTASTLKGKYTNGTTRIDSEVNVDGFIGELKAVF